MLASMEKKLISPTVHFVSGKGGVGKSIVSLALANYFAGEGHSTLLVELSEEESDAAHDRIASIRKVKEKLSFIRIYPDQALFEYLKLKVPAQALLDKLLSKSLFRTLCSAMPGLSDLTRLGKIWFHADPVHGNREGVFDKIVVDLPSSGFILGFLSIARVVKEVVRIGPLARDAQLIQDYFSNSKNALIHLVSLPQDVVINETFEIYQQLKKANEVAMGMLFMNRVIKLDPNELALFRDKSQDNFPHTTEVMDFFLSQVKAQTHQLKRLEDLGLSMPRINLSEQFGEIIESKISDELVEKMTEYFNP